MASSGSLLTMPAFSLTISSMTCVRSLSRSLRVDLSCSVILSKSSSPTERYLSGELYSSTGTS